MQDFFFFSGSSNLPLAKKVADGLGIKLGQAEIDHFSNAETRVRIAEDVKNKTCFLLQSLSTPTDQNWVETLFLLDALKRGGATKIIGLLPWLGYQKQDKAFRGGEAVSVAVVVKTLETMGMEQMITFDLHSPGILNYFQNPPVVLSAFPLFLKEIDFLCHSRESGNPVHSRKNWIPDQVGDDNNQFVVVAPDAGAYWAKDFAKKLGIDFLQLEKHRDKKTAAITITGCRPVLEHIDGKIALIVDDVIYTGSTLIEAAKLLKQNGARKVFCFATHAILSEDASSLLQNSQIDSLTVTDTIFMPKEKPFPKLKIISVAQLLSKALCSVIPAKAGIQATREKSGSPIRACPRPDRGSGMTDK